MPPVQGSLPPSTSRAATSTGAGRLRSNGTNLEQRDTRRIGHRTELGSSLRRAAG